MASSFISPSLRLRAQREQEERRQTLTTYTTSLRLTSDMKDFLKDFYRHIYTPVKQEHYRMERSTYPEVNSFYETLVESSTTPSSQVSLEDFWQRYEYRCGNLNRIAMELLKEDHLLDTSSKKQQQQLTTSPKVLFSRDETVNNNDDQNRQDSDCESMTVISSSSPQDILPSIMQPCPIRTDAIDILEQVVEDARKRAEMEPGDSPMALSEQSDEVTSQGLQWEGAARTFPSSPRDGEVSRIEEETDETTSKGKNPTDAGISKEEFPNKHLQHPDEQPDEDTVLTASDNSIQKAQPQDENIPVKPSEEETSSSNTGKDNKKAQKWKDRLTAKRANRENILKDVNHEPVNECPEPVWQLEGTISVEDPSISVTRGLVNEASTAVLSYDRSIQASKKDDSIRHLPVIEEDEREDPTTVACYEAVGWGNQLYDIVQEAERSLTAQKAMYGKFHPQRLQEDDDELPTEYSSGSPRDLQEIVSFAYGFKPRLGVISKGSKDVRSEPNEKTAIALNPDWIRKPDMAYASLLEDSSYILAISPDGELSTELFNSHSSPTHSNKTNDAEDDSIRPAIRPATPASVTSASSRLVDELVVYFSYDETVYSSHEEDDDTQVRDEECDSPPLKLSTGTLTPPLNLSIGTPRSRLNDLMVNSSPEPDMHPSSTYPDVDVDTEVLINRKEIYEVDDGNVGDDECDESLSDSSVDAMGYTNGEDDNLDTSPSNVYVDVPKSVPPISDFAAASSYFDDNSGSKEKCDCQSSCNVM